MGKERPGRLWLQKLDVDEAQGQRAIVGNTTILFEGSLEAKLPTIWKDGNGTARKKLGRGES